MLDHSKTSKELGHLLTSHMRITAWTLKFFAHSLYQFWPALKMHCLGLFAWSKWPVLLFQTFSYTSDRFWKDLGQLNTLQLAPTLTLKRTKFTQLTIKFESNWIRSLCKYKSLHVKIIFSQLCEWYIICTAKIVSLTSIENPDHPEGSGSYMECSYPGMGYAAL